MTELERRLTELANNRSSHSEGKYGPHVDGVKVADLRAVLSELEALKEKNRQLETETLKAADTGILDDNGAPVFWPELVDKLKAENERLKTELEDARRIAARVLDEDTEKRLAEEMARVIWGGHEPDGWKEFIGEARIALAYLKGEAS